MKARWLPLTASLILIGALLVNLPAPARRTWAAADLPVSVDHRSFVADCQIRHFPLDLAIQREQMVIY